MKRAIAWLVAALLGACLRAEAASPYLDPTFGSGGVAPFNSAPNAQSPYPIQLASGRIAMLFAATWFEGGINLGNIYYELGQFQQARDRYTRACALDGENPRTHFNLANACDEMGDMLGALRLYRHALRLWPGYADAHFNLALVAEKLSAWGLACRHWQRFLDLEAGGEWVAVARSHLEDARQSLARARRRTRGRTG